MSARGEVIAAIIVEPMLQGAGGMIVWPAEFLAGVQKICTQHNTLLIADEVLTGFGRTGRLFASEHAGVQPDLICLSKALTAGYLPLGVTATTDKIYEAFLSDDRSAAFFHGHSYTANPLACAVARASLQLFRDESTMDRVRTIEAHFRRRLEQLQHNPMVGEARGIGAVAAIELATKTGGYLDDIGPRLAAAFLERGLLLRPLGNIVYFMPPYVISESEVEWAFDQISEVLRDIERAS
jgi:adenosylmethionine-8-amino-7-oxononanoate aminotransferase